MKWAVRSTIYTEKADKQISKWELNAASFKILKTSYKFITVSGVKTMPSGRREDFQALVTVNEVGSAEDCLHCTLQHNVELPELCIRGC